MSRTELRRIQNQSKTGRELNAEAGFFRLRSDRIRPSHADFYPNLEKKNAAKLQNTGKLHLVLFEKVPEFFFCNKKVSHTWPAQIQLIMTINYAQCQGIQLKSAE